MTTTRARLRRAALAAGVTLAGAGVVWLATSTLAGAGGAGPFDQVRVDDIAVSAGDHGSATIPLSDPVPPDIERPELAALTGVVTECGNDHCVNGLAVDFGAPWYLDRTTAGTDHDGDGRIELLGEEITGLVGHEVTFVVEFGRTGDVSVYAIDGVFYRAEIGPPPWVGGG